MPFEPRVIPHDDSDDADGALAPELAALAEQLSEDAAMLARRYPAPVPGTLTRLSATGRFAPEFSAIGALDDHRSDLPVPAPSTNWWRIAAAVSFIAAGLGTVVFVAGQFFGPWTQPRFTAQLPHGPLAGVQQVVSPPPHPPGPSAGAEASLPEVLPAMSFQELTGPEQEAVLDLLEDKVLGQASLSI